MAANSDFVRISQHALGLKLDCRPTQQEDVTVFDVELADTTGHDRAVTLVYAWPIAADSLRWLHDPCDVQAVQAGREYLNASNFRVAGGRLSRYPFAAVADAQSGWALGIDMARPAFFRLGYNATTEELFLAYDLGLTPEKPTARLRFCRYRFDPQWEFRAALARYYEIFPEAFRCRTPEQGLWMPFAPISRVEGFDDFGFKFKEGTNETAWDDEHDIFTFRYTEPMTWWMPLPERSPRTLDAALAEAQKLAEQGNAQARALLTSGYHNEDGQIPARLLDTPWCNGAVWSINSMPGIVGEVTDFQNKWNPTLRQRLYGPQRSADLDGEYIDSSEGYVTDELDFRRDHFAACDTPLTFAPETHRPAIFRGLIAFEYIRAIAADVHAMDKLMMANSTPIRLCWLAPLLDVMGTETDWNPGGNWQPMSDRELLYRRALCKGKPFCFLMNTQFERFSYERVERYMKRSLAYGMFPGFFSHNASQGHYFTRPELYNRDRPLFKKYVPLCRQVAEAGWEPITRARCSDPQLHLERFGQRYLTVLNVTSDPCTATIRLEGDAPATSRDLVSGREIFWQHQQTELTLAPEDVALIDLRAENGNPKVAMLWASIRGDSSLEAVARHDLVMLGWGSLGLQLNRQPPGLADGFTRESIEAARAKVQRLRQLHPGIVVLADLMFYEWPDKWLPDDHPWWLRSGGQRQQFWPGTHRMNWYDADYRQHVVRQTVSLKQTGVDGVFYDNLRDEPEPWVAFLAGSTTAGR